jgi:hypothetical protein
MGKATKQKKNLIRKQAKMKVKKDIEILMEECDLKEIEALDDNMYYQLESDAGELLFNGQDLLGSLIKSMVKEASKTVTKDE